MNDKAQPPASILPQALDLDLGERSYRIDIGDGLLSRAGTLLEKHITQDRVFVVTDENVHRHHWEVLEQALRKSGFETKLRVLPAGEGTKSFSQLQALTDWLLGSGVDRKSTVIAFGGGVIGDLVGFAAAITMRGIDFIQIPTTLLSQVDSSVGGKTGINTEFGKNLVGAFHQPKHVLIDVATLDTLPKRQILSGYAEVVKYALIGDDDFFNWCDEHGPALIEGDKQARQYAIYKSCEHKARVVAADEREQGKRALLNLGHTFGHAFEAETGYGEALFHGEAVAIGTVMAFDLSCRLGFCAKDDLERVQAHFKKTGLRVSLEGLVDESWSVQKLLEHMGRDKKTEAGVLHFVLVKGIGDGFLYSAVPDDVLRAILSDALNVPSPC